ncbi:MAG: anti-sigma factor family protein, partial [Planctomycetota bacterium]
MKKACQRVREQIPELVSGALGPEKAGELRQHIGTCPACSEYLRCLKADDKQLRDYVEGMQSTLARLEDGVIEALSREPSREPIGLVSIWRTLRKSTIAKIAAAAVIIIVALICVEILIGPYKEPRPGMVKDIGGRVRENGRSVVAGQLESGVARVEEMVAAGDIEGLVAMLDGGEVESRMMAAYYLASIGEDRGTAALKELLPVYIAGDPNRVTVLAKFAKGLAVDKEVSDRSAEILKGHKDGDA